MAAGCRQTIQDVYCLSLFAVCKQMNDVIVTDERQDQKGVISKRDLYETCCQFNIPIGNEHLTQLFDLCDVNKDGLIDYVEFSNFLNWKTPMPSGFPKRQHPTFVARPVIIMHFASNRPTC